MAEPADRGRQTLALIAEHLGRYNAWVFEQIRPAIRGSVLEVGAGIGNMSAFLLGAPRLALTDVDPASLADLERRFGRRQGVTIARWDLNAPPPEAIARERFDTVLCLNVLEHIEADRQALAHMRALLAPGGRLVLLVPSHPWLFNRLDRAVRHHRRYDRAGLASRLAEAGFVSVRTWRFNALGALGWWLNGSLLGREVLPGGQLRLIDRLVPLLKLERLAPRPLGLSIIAIAEA